MDLIYSQGSSHGEVRRSTRNWERRITGKGNMMTNAETGIIHSEVDEGGATSQGMQTSTEDEKDKEAGFLLELLEGISPANI